MKNKTHVFFLMVACFVMLASFQPGHAALPLSDEQLASIYGGETPCGANAAIVAQCTLAGQNGGQCNPIPIIGGCGCKDRWDACATVQSNILGASPGPFEEGTATDCATVTKKTYSATLCLFDCLGICWETSSGPKACGKVTHLVTC